MKNRIEEFHKTFGLPMPVAPQAPTPERLRRFREILADEMAEGEMVQVQVEFNTPGLQNAALVDFADWLGDIIVYCWSEARRHGIPMDQVLEIIMDSNASKLGPDGLAIIRNGKVQKGPGYWKPEPKIAELLGVKL